MMINSVYMKGMRYFFLLLLVSFPALFLNCGHSSGSNTSGTAAGDTGTAKIIFTEYEHLFGKVTEGEKLSNVFSFKNEGTGSLIISAATASCGCTVPKYDRKPIAPGESGSIEVIFDTSGKSGMQTKTITVRSNAKPPVTLLRIKAEVNEGK
jgi:hypothetical protein